MSTSTKRKYQWVIQCWKCWKVLGWHTERPKVPPKCCGRPAKVFAHGLASGRR